MDTDTPELLINVHHENNSSTFRIYCEDEYSMMTLSLLLSISHIIHAPIHHDKFMIIPSKDFNRTMLLLYPKPDKH